MKPEMAKRNNTTKQCPHAHSYLGNQHTINEQSTFRQINNLATSQTLAMAALARELKAQGKDIISLGELTLIHLILLRLLNYR
jgi:hypothetical protein